MKRIATGVFAAAAAITIALPAQAQDGFPYSINIHVTVPSYTGCAEGFIQDSQLNCDIISPNGIDLGQFNPNFAWVLVGGVPPIVSDAGGISGLQFGVEYEAGVLVAGWALCTGGSEIPQEEPVGWPASGTGNAMTWPGGCYEVTANADGVTKVGWFTINPGTVGMMDIIEDPRIAIAAATDCQTTLVRVCKQLLGSGDLTNTGGGGTGGESTCGNFCPVPVQETSWGGIKSIYN